MTETSSSPEKSQAPKEKVIEGNAYTCFLWSPRVGLKLGNRIGRILGPAAGGLFGSIKSSDADEKEVEITPSKIMAELFDRINDNDLDYIMDTVFEYVKLDGAPIKWNAMYGGRYQEMFQVVVWAIESNYGFFFADIPKYFGITAHKVKVEFPKESGQEK